MGKHERPQVSVNEMRAWAMQSRMQAERDRMSLTAANVRYWEELLNEWQKSGIVMVELRPITHTEWKEGK